MDVIGHLHAERGSGDSGRYSVTLWNAMVNCNMIYVMCEVTVDHKVVMTD